MCHHDLSYFAMPVPGSAAMNQHKALLFLLPLNGIDRLRGQRGLQETVPQKQNKAQKPTCLLMTA